MSERIEKIIEDKGKRTAFDLVIGSAIVNIVFLTVGIILCVIFKWTVLTYVTGILLGQIVTVFMIVHMYSVLEKAMLCDKKTAKRKTKFGALIRMFVIVGALIAGALLPQCISIIGVFLGIFALKIAALFQPLFDTLVMKFVKKEE